ncbi:MAG: DUF3039 domain-containing protein [Actinomycetota bacterium]|nr:DUF3039 domain-containing protein [Actinomycetota bacterium]MDH4352571.1 DUF3039 domain-containing protein [Actinomycetota bacterium]MDH5278241.1 DUF3039 domain-containing protein [Actinomycetota bacterium]
MSEPQDPSGPTPLTDEPGGGLGTLTEDRVVPAETEEGDHERFAHYVKKDKIVESAVLGAPVIALCGKVWVPNRDPQRFPVCPECQEIFQSLPPGGGA